MDSPARTRIQIKSREQLFCTLTEAVEIEHNLMCCSLYAAFSLKNAALDGIAPEDDLLISRWGRSIMSVAVEEMTHLALVANLMTALGGPPHLGRPNFPIEAGYHPAGVQAKLAPFSSETLQHFIFLERPEGSAEPNGEGFTVQTNYVRALGVHNVLMPSAQDYETVGDLYRAIGDGVQSLAERSGETALFVGDPSARSVRTCSRLPGLMRISGVESALRAIDTIVRQGEGASEDLEGSHFQRFVAIRTELQARGDRGSGGSVADINL
ncbi:MAG: ferritin-like protein [Bradyrhizobium sp.]|uniref:ferritin-like domain-containing protein n=1 Tax=Bradyrhizobium sp. TaxID=376 RepID=UPI001D529D82|nr:ferritin-like protein [Bradyrhizobium sp.]MBV9562154.1 ferritin-like protein [Bradyrhizobium sp.]